MIFYCVTREGHSTISGYLATRGRTLAGGVRIVAYEHLRYRRTLPAGTYIFSDVERLSPADATRAAGVWLTLADRDGVRLLNHPTRSMRRFELLRALHDLGVNRANCYRVTDRRSPERFPVFIRHENDHAGARSRLLHSPEELARELARFEDAGVYRDDLIVTEFCATDSDDGVVRKYSAFRIGDRIVPRHVLFGRDWHLKVVDLVEPKNVREELEYVHTNPHCDALLAICDTARIQFGRVDYGLADGRIQVWEINTNPILGTFDEGGMPARAPVVAAVNPAFAEAFAVLDQDGAHSPVVLIPVGRPARAIVRARLRAVLAGLLIGFGLERYELRLSTWLARIWRGFFGAAR